MDIQGIWDLMKFADKELIEKFVKIIKHVEVEEIEGGTKVSIYLLDKK